jgi:uncharacterized protein involved in tolerance to divalent cations
MLNPTLGGEGISLTNHCPKRFYVSEPMHTACVGITNIKANNEWENTFELAEKFFLVLRTITGNIQWNLYILY